MPDKNGNPLEHEEQATVVAWAALMSGSIPELYLLYAIPNGAKLPYSVNKKTGRRYSKQAQWLIEEGLKPGVPDLCLPVARKNFHGLYIEMKRGDNKPSDSQEAFLDALAAQGYLAVVCWGAQDAIEVLTEYING